MENKTSLFQKIRNLSKEKKLNIILILVNLTISALFYARIDFIVQHISQVAFITLDFVISLILFTTPFISYLRGYKNYSIFICLLNGISFFLINYLNFTFYRYGIKGGTQMGFYVLVMTLIISVLVRKSEN